MKIATQHYQDSVITPYGNNHWNGKEKIDISKETFRSCRGACFASGG